MAYIRVPAEQDDNLGLNDSDVEFIQNVLDDSSDDEIDFMQSNAVPRPKKKTEEK